jgi:glutaredoxin 3
MKHVTIYTTDPCARCGKAKALLRRHGATWDEINLTKDPDGRAELSARTGLLTFPQIVVDGVTLGGLAELETLEAGGELAGLLDAAAA